MAKAQEDRELWREQRTCKRKQAYNSKEADERLLLKYRQKGWIGSKYKCPYCGWYHITKQMSLPI